MHGALHGDGPRDVAQQQRDGAGEVHDATAEAAHEQRDGDAADEGPAGDADVDLLLGEGVVHADHAEEVAYVKS